MTYRQYFATHPRENTEWCRPFMNGSVKLALQDEEIIVLEINGEDVNITPETIKAAAEAVGADGSDADALLQADGWEELGCKSCPWFDTCDQMLEAECRGYSPR